MHLLFDQAISLIILDEWIEQACYNVFAGQASITLSPKSQIGFSKMVQLKIIYSLF